MKRIIELSENDYMELKKDGVQNHLALADTIIAHSKPYEERPQGKWVEYQEDNAIWYYCSNCKVTKIQAVNNFCCCCGADMRGKEGDNNGANNT